MITNKILHLLPKADPPGRGLQGSPARIIKRKQSLVKRKRTLFPTTGFQGSFPAVVNSF